MGEPWWKTAVVYQIYPRSFATADPTGEARAARIRAAQDKYPVASLADANQDGVGDLEGIRGRLDHLEWLGVDAVWISPFYRSPMADFGYDVADYCDVDPLFGTLDDFDRLVAEAHERGIRVLVDWVPNHSSDQHPWFLEARSSRDSTKRDWYIWHDGDAASPPNNWKAAFGGDAWTWDEATGQWYLHLFLPEQPDLNWRNPDVVAAMHDTLRFWLDRGVDGFRIDVVHGIVKHLDLPDMPEGKEWSQDRFDEPATHEVVRGVRRLADSYPGDPVLVGEVYVMSTAKVAEFYGAGDELHLAFNFPPLYAPWEAAKWHKRIERVAEELDPREAWPTWVLSNHDNPRHRTRYGGSEARARAAAVLLLTLRGTPFMYAGEELGLEDAVIPDEAVVDPGGRDGCRAPIPWDGTPGHGWGSAEPWLPWPPDPDTRNVEALRSDPGSILHLYRRLLAARRASPALQVGTWEAVDAPDGVIAYRRAADGDERVVIVNYTDAAVDVPVDGELRVEVASDGADEGAPYAGTLAASAALILRP